MTVTISAIDLCLYGTGASFTFGVILWMQAWRLPPGWKAGFITVLGFVFIIFGSLGLAVHNDLAGRAANASIFDKLPSEWKVFHAELSQINDWHLQGEAIKRFASTNPPQLSVENYDALTGERLWNSKPQVCRSLKASASLRTLVNLDFADGKQ